MPYLVAALLTIVPERCASGFQKLSTKTKRKSIIDCLYYTRVIITFNICRILIKLACELIAVASQNNPPCQKAFLPVLTKLLELVRDVKSIEDVKIQAVRAISSRCFLTINGATLNYLIPRDGLGQAS